ncbi:hypothetical protein ACHAXA_007094 [Cyclostephanos tholiformis]|uniref:Uncharacterized protein n=1 Tax=Cyclostephanos tholiformis TaxID=382380 RepID=A0ABD3RZ45_9STRA
MRAMTEHGSMMKSMRRHETVALLLLLLASSSSSSSFFAPSGTTAPPTASAFAFVPHPPPRVPPADRRSRSRVDDVSSPPVFFFAEFAPPDNDDDVDLRGRDRGGMGRRVAAAAAAATTTTTTTMIKPSSPTSPPTAPPPAGGAATAATTATRAMIDFYAALDGMYDESISIRCPFFRRRVADLIDDVASVVRFLVIRHKSLPVISDLLNDEHDGDVVVDDVVPFPPVNPGCKPLGRHMGRDFPTIKARHTHISRVADRVRDDWTNGPLGPSKGYYITGRLDPTLYRDDCLFTGPDPDMPVRGLRKYLNAASSLFDARMSDAVLLSLTYDERGGECERGMIVATWRLGGVINLPWHPTVEPWTGTTRYHLDDEGLIRLHQEYWDISVWRAFVCTLIPGMRRIWDAGRITARV